MEVGQSCGTCVYFRPNNKQKPSTEEQGQCRCNPPQIIVLQSEADIPQFIAAANGGITQTSGKQIVNKAQPMFAPMLARDPGCGQYENARGGTNPLLSIWASKVKESD